MKLDRQCFLIFKTDPETGARSVEIAPDFGDSLGGWGPTTRVSPIFSVTGFSKKPSPTATTFRNPCWLLFLGPVHPLRVVDEFPAVREMHLWLTLGLFNVILQIPTAKMAGEIFEWAKAKKISIEKWEVRNSKVLRPRSWRPTAQFEALEKRVLTLARKIPPSELREAIQEYCPLVLSTLNRAGQFPPEFIADLESIHDHIEKTLASLNDEHGEGPTSYQVLGQIITINAALARFSSQTFAGTSPIAQTECHFWSNSLLGIGVATLGLWKVNRFLENKLGKARLAARIISLGSVTDNIPRLSSLPISDLLWTSDHLKKPPVATGKTDAPPLIPLLTYFSGREGFNSTETTISAPLASVAACNSLRWSLLTITHEISHILVNVMAVQIYPRLRSDAEIGAALVLLNDPAPRTYLEEIRQFLLSTIIGMEATHAPNKKIELDRERFVTVIEHWQREVEEILVHTFDFLWFYGRESEKYVRGIWMSWATVPNIKNRIKDYVVRTISAVLTRYLLQGKEAEDLAKDVVVNTLTALKAEGLGGDHVDAALRYIDLHWETEIRDRVVIRKDLVKLVQAFLFSESLATEVRKEEAIVGGTDKAREGYPLIVNEIDNHTITNPLRFLELYTGNKPPSPTESAWFFYILAFCVEIA
jgi:sulfur relay (sulfurtransferase) DsrC/TusE family protein